MLNIYKSKYDKFSIDLNELVLKSNYFNDDIKTNINEDIFKHVENLDIDKYFLNKAQICLYNPPLINKLFPKSNLYGHELIRYYDF